VFGGAAEHFNYPARSLLLRRILRYISAEYAYMAGAEALGHTTHFFTFSTSARCSAGLGWHMFVFIAMLYSSTVFL
jgi:hypothetical protein